MCRKKKAWLLAALLFMLSIVYSFPCIKGTVKINGDDYLFAPRLNFKMVTMHRVEKVPLGINYYELIEIIGKQNGELNNNAILNNVYYRMGIDRFVVFHFDYNEDYLWWQSVEGGQLTGIYLYNHKECLGIIKEYQGESE